MVFVAFSYAPPMSSDTAFSAAQPGHARGVRTKRIEVDGGADVAFHGLDGPPGMCVMAAHLGAFGRLGDSRRPAGRVIWELPAKDPLAGMISGMTTTKIAVSLPAELVEQAQRAVAEGRANSVSAYVADALEEKAKLDDLASLLDEMLAETGGPLSAKERKAADRALGR